MAAKREAGAGGSGDPGRPGEPARSGDPGAPDALWARPRRGVGSKILIGVGLLALLGYIGASRRPPPPNLAPNCEKASFALSSATVKAAKPLTYTIVGPNAHRYVLGVDTLSFVRADDGSYSAVPVPGREDSYEVAAGVKPMKGCRRTGIFALPVPPGDHVVTLYELTDTDVVEVERQTITVTESD
jgi:hypothetical protein